MFKKKEQKEVQKPERPISYRDKLTGGDRKVDVDSDLAHILEIEQKKRADAQQKLKSLQVQGDPKASEEEAPPPKPPKPT